MQRMMCRPGRFPLVGQEDGGMLTPDHVGHGHDFEGYRGSQLEAFIITMMTYI